MQIILGLSIGFIYSLLLLLIKSRSKYVVGSVLVISLAITIFTCGYGASDYFLYTFLKQDKPSLLFLINGFIIATPVFLSTFRLIKRDENSNLYILLSLGFFFLNVIGFTGSISLPSIMYMITKNELLPALTQNLLLIGMYIPLMFLVLKLPEIKN